MGDSTDVQALEKISSEVDESQIKITLSSHCIKAQAYLVDKLRKQSERQKELCIFVSNSNLKLEAEIKQAEQEIQSLRTAYETIRSANVELRKELLIAKENRANIEEHVKVVEKKYEDLWLECKSRYESIPYVQTLLQTTKAAQILGDETTSLQHEAHNLVKDIDLRKTELMQLDRKRVIELANYLINEMPKTLNIINEKSKEISSLKQEIEEISKERKSKENSKKMLAAVEIKKSAPITVDLNVSNTEDNWPQLSSKDSLPMPKLKLVGTDFDVLSAKLDQIKIKKGEMLHTTPVKRTDSLRADEESPIYKRPKKCEENIPYYFSQHINVEENDNDIQDKCNFSNRKLINILADIKLDKNETYNLISKVNPENLRDVNVIGNDTTTNVIDKAAKPIESEHIEEIDLTVSNSGNIVGPPTQFMDYTQEKRSSQQPADIIVHMPMTGFGENNTSSPKNSQENVKKRVSFDLSSSVQITQVDDEACDDEPVQNVEAEASKTNSELDVSGVSDDGFMRMRDMILKKHNLDSSPQFVYAKNTAIKPRAEGNVTSKFFQPARDSVIVENCQVPQKGGNNTTEREFETQDDNNKEEIILEKDEDIADSGLKDQEAQKVYKPVRGFLFKHGTQGIPDSLNVSISTTGFDEGEADFPHCIDSSLLLSPKADLPMPMSGENPEVLSQDVPNFLSGLRKTGLSFFGLSSTVKTNEDNAPQNSSNNFNFNFGRDDKKARGGLFSMFH